jgi:hypothetical protein
VDSSASSRNDSAFRLAGESKGSPAIDVAILASSAHIDFLKSTGTEMMDRKPAVNFSPAL